MTSASTEPVIEPALAFDPLSLVSIPPASIRRLIIEKEAEDSRCTELERLVAKVKEAMRLLQWENTKLQWENVLFTAEHSQLKEDKRKTHGILEEVFKAIR